MLQEITNELMTRVVGVADVNGKIEPIIEDNKTAGTITTICVSEMLNVTSKTTFKDGVGNKVIFGIGENLETHLKTPVRFNKLVASVQGY